MKRDRKPDDEDPPLLVVQRPLDKVEDDLRCILGTTLRYEDHQVEVIISDQPMDCHLRIRMSMIDGATVYAVLAR